MDKIDALLWEECERLLRATELRGLRCTINQPKDDAPFVVCPRHPEIEVCTDTQGKFLIWYHHYHHKNNPSPLIFGLTVDAAAELLAMVSARDKPMTKGEIKALSKYIPPENVIYSGSREPDETEEQYQNKLITTILADKSG